MSDAYGRICENNEVFNRDNNNIYQESVIKKEPAVNNVSFTQHLLHTTGYHQVRIIVFYLFKKNNCLFLI